MKLVSIVLAITILQAVSIEAAPQSAPLWSIGGEDGVGTELGANARFVALPNHLLIIERDAPFLKLVTLDGRVRQQVGRLGGGPSEFRQPTDAYFDAARGELFVVDGAAVRVSVYALGDSIRFLRSLVAPEPGLVGLCSLRGRWFGLTRNAATMLREFGIEQDRLVVKRAFAEPKSRHPLAAIPALRNESSGALLCDERRGELIVISRVLGEVHRIDAEGRRHTVDTLPGFKAVPMVLRDGMLSAEFRNGDTWDQVTSAAPLASGFAITAVRKTRSPQVQGADGYLTYALAPVPTASPPPLAAWGLIAAFGSRVVCLRDEPAPTLAMFAGRSCPPR